MLATMPAYNKEMPFGTTGGRRAVPGQLPREFYIGAYLKLALLKESESHSLTFHLLILLSTDSSGVLPRLMPHADAPISVPVSESSCRVLVTMPSNLPPTRAKWSDIWAGGVAVNTMCVQHGLTGTAKWFGR